MLGEDVLYLSVRELGDRIRKRSLSPVELTQSYLERGRTIGKRLNAYATMTPDLALEQARAAEREIAAGKYRGPLHGIPYAAKDLLAVPGYPTTWGAKPYAQPEIRLCGHSDPQAAGGGRGSVGKGSDDRASRRTRVSVRVGVADRSGQKS